jgi:hypothetical protein
MFIRPARTGFRPLVHPCGLRINNKTTLGDIVLGGPRLSQYLSTHQWTSPNLQLKLK